MTINKINDVKTIEKIKKKMTRMISEIEIKPF